MCIVRDYFTSSALHSDSVPACDDHRDLPSFPTRRSSDLDLAEGVDAGESTAQLRERVAEALQVDRQRFSKDRKSTRLNSSHVAISYAVFCLKKKKRREGHRYTKAEQTRSSMRY